MEQKLDDLLFEIAVTAVAVLPLSWIIATAGRYEPFGWFMVLQSLRLVKIKPIIVFWGWAKNLHLNIMILFQSVFLYYYAVHYFACIMIGIAVHKEDHRDTWLRKLPSPDVNGLRSTKNVFDDMTPLLVYNNAQYFEVNTLSNLAIGDVSAVTCLEKFLNGFNIWLGTFINNLVYCSNFTAVAYLITGPHIEYFRNYHDMLSKIRNGKVTESVINNVRGFFDYIWYRHRGVSFD